MGTMEREKLNLATIIMDMGTTERERQSLAIIIMAMDTMEREKLNPATIIMVMATMANIMVMDIKFSPKISSKLKNVLWNAFKRNTHLISQMKQKYRNKKVKTE